MNKVNWLKTSYGNSPPTPDISEHPQSRTVTPGTAVAFSVVASGPSTLTYQWRKGGSAIAGATGPSLQINAPQATDIGSYDVVVYADGVPATSNPALLQVIDNFSAWSTRHGLSGPDGDDDGIDDLVEFALGLDPDAPSNPYLPELIDEAAGLIYRFTRPRNLTGLIYTLRSSPDLSDWSQTFPLHVESFTTATETLASIIPPGQVKRFLKLEVKLP